MSDESKSCYVIKFVVGDQRIINFEVIKPESKRRFEYILKRKVKFELKEKKRIQFIVSQENKN
jgi:hypothetical protein